MGAVSRRRPAPATGARRRPASALRRPPATRFAILPRCAGQPDEAPRRLGGVDTSSNNEPAVSSETLAALRERRVSTVDRRALTWRTLLTGGLSPRRRGGPPCRRARAARRFSRALSAVLGRRDAELERLRRVSDG